MSGVTSRYLQPEPLMTSTNYIVMSALSGGRMLPYAYAMK